MGILVQAVMPRIELVGVLNLPPHQRSIKLAPCSANRRYPRCNLLEGVRKCVVNADVINNRTRPLLMTVNEQIIPYAETA